MKKKMSIEIFLEEFLHKIVSKEVFEYRERSELKAPSGTFSG